MPIDNSGKRITWRLPSIGEDKYAEGRGMSEGEEEDEFKDSDMQDLDEIKGMRKSGKGCFLLYISLVFRLDLFYL